MKFRKEKKLLTCIIINYLSFMDILCKVKKNTLCKCTFTHYQRSTYQVTHKAEIPCFHSADDRVLHKPGCPVGFYSHEFHCSLIYMEQKKKFNNMQNATTPCRLKHAHSKLK